MTALDNIVNMQDKTVLRAAVRALIEEYLANFPNRHKLSADQLKRLTEVEHELVLASIEHVECYA